MVHQKLTRIATTALSSGPGAKAAAVGRLPMHPILQLQRTLGNRRTTELLAAGRIAREGPMVGGHGRLEKDVGDNGQDLLSRNPIDETRIVPEPAAHSAALVDAEAAHAAAPDGGAGNSGPIVSEEGSGPRKQNQAAQQDCSTQKWGRTFDSAMTGSTNQVNPIVASRVASREGDATSVMFHTGGVTRSAAVWQIVANVNMTPNNLGDQFLHGLIQTAKSLEFVATYDDGTQKKRQATNARDADPSAPAPWYQPASMPSGPRIIGKDPQAGLVDLPRNYFPVQSGKAKIRQISCSGTFNVWHVAKNPAGSGTSEDGLVFLSNLQVGYQGSATLAPNGNWVGTAQTPSITAAQCGKGSQTPMLNGPLASKLLNPEDK